jgi:NAD(P)-dependent dehydrogenase (short-subunit alcohol dehydrogenase family)
MGQSGRAVMVTGSTGELGATVVRRYLLDGAHVAAIARDAAKADPLRASVGELAGSAEDPRLLILEADPADRAGMDRAVDEVVRRWGRLDALANLAGGYDKTEPWDMDAIDASWARNVRTVVVATAACLRPMRARGYGRIVSVGSFGANKGGKDSAGYAMSKTALVRWTEALAAAVKDEGITANVVQPSIIDHPQNRRDHPKADPAKWVSPAELAAVILFLTDEASSAITGVAIPVVARV